MLIVSAQLFCKSLFYRNSIRLRNTGTSFFYAFLPRRPFVCLSVGVGWFIRICCCDLGRCCPNDKDHFCLLMRCPTNYLLNLFAKLCTMHLTINIIPHKVYICLHISLNLNITNRLRELNVPYFFFVYLNCRRIVTFNNDTD